MNKIGQIEITRVKETLRHLHLKDMAIELESVLTDAQHEKQGYMEFLHRLISIQVDAVNKRSVERRIKKASLYKAMDFDSFDWNFQPELNVPLVKDLMGLHFLVKKQPVLMFGKTGTGKTHLATALGIRACQEGYRVASYKFQQLLNRLYASMADETTESVMDKLARLDLLIIDEVRNIRVKPEYPSLFLDLINVCQNHVSLIVTSNISVAEWGQTLGNAAIVSAIVDRLFQNACVINITGGRSYRTKGPHGPQFLKGIVSTETEPPLNIAP